MDGACNEFSSRYHDAAALCRVASDNGFLESLRTVGLVVTDGANLVMSKSRAGKTGGLMRARMAGKPTRDRRCPCRKQGSGAWLSKLPEASAAEYSGAGSKRRCCSKTFYQFTSLHCPLPIVFTILFQHNVPARVSITQPRGSIHPSPQEKQQLGIFLLPLRSTA